MSNNLMKYARDLAELFQDDGDEISALDILDNLATLGLTLVPATGENEASNAYIEALQS